MSKLKLQKGSVLRHMTSVIQPILEKGIVDHSILHRVLLEYFSIADKVLLSRFTNISSRLLFLQQISPWAIVSKSSFLKVFCHRYNPTVIKSTHC